MTLQLTEFVRKGKAVSASKSIANSFHVQKNDTNRACRQCGTTHKLKECPAVGKTCNLLFLRTPLAAKIIPVLAWLLDWILHLGFCL